ncbi:FadR/GntR family transcriptional regulator [Pseudonocardia humida]|uniref:FadR family transcriptional regulator n=1 Tax=Pseudonocardia humida TaxID=2800819 RepID=A0ABT0ZYF5_9PSEU|nr:GntR family transcriptional regulator [Pseudonocardia humida]MCO1655746.1 FadR family transcriptional regulator [Pseudonocardia humida]
MTLDRVHRAGLVEAVFQQLRAAILEGDLPPGSRMPSERTLVERFGVSRPVVREALSRLEHSSLIRVQQGASTTVRDWRTEGDLGVLLDLAEVGAVGHLERDIIEARQAIGSDAARRCAQRATPHDVAAITAAADDLAGAGPDLVELDRRNLVFWRAVMVATQNIAYQLAYNSLISGRLAPRDQPVQGRVDELVDITAHRQLAVLIAAGEAEAAAAVAWALLDRTEAPVSDEATG